MADWAFADSSRFAVGGTVATIGGGTVTGAGANTKGAWQQLSTVPFDTDMLTVETQRISTLLVGADKYALMDIGRGTAGAEQIIISNLPSINSEAEVGCYHYDFPYLINAGEVLSARVQSPRVNSVFSVGFHFQSHGFAHFASASRIKTYGVDTATSKSTTIAFGAANVKGAWSQIAASTSEDICAIYLAFNDAALSGLDNDWYLIDVGIGAAGSENIRIPDIPFVTYSANSAVNPYLSGPWSISIPAGSRIAVRQQSTATFREVHVAIIAVSR